MKHPMPNAMILSIKQPDVWCWQRFVSPEWYEAAGFPSMKADPSLWRCVPRAWVDDPESVEVRKRLRGGNSEWTRWGTITGEWDHETYEYEIRPRQRMITISERTIHEPMREAPELRTKYFIPDLSKGDWYSATLWNGDGFDYRCLERGLCHTTAENAIAAAKAATPFPEQEKQG